MVNLWKETIEILENNGKTWEDVQLIFGEDFQVTKENFEVVSKKTEYDNGFGSQKIASDLVIIGTGFVMNREEYDGSECWKFIPTGFDIPKNFKEITALGGGYWNTLKEINSEEENQNK